MINQQILTIFKSVFSLSIDYDWTKEPFPVKVGADLYNVRIVTADKPIFFFDRASWNKVFLVPRPWTYYTFHVTDQKGEEVPLIKAISVDDNPFNRFFSTVLFDRQVDRSGKTVTERMDTFEKKMKDIAYLALQIEYPAPAAKAFRTAGRTIALPFYPLYFFLSQMRAILGLEEAVFRPRLTYPFYVDDIRKICKMVDDLRFEYGCIRKESILQQEVTAAVFDIEIDPVRQYWGRIRTRINYFFAGDNSGDQIRKI